MFYLSTLQLRGIAQSVSSDVEITHAALVQELEAKSKVRIEPPAFIIGFEYKKKKKKTSSSRRTFYTATRNSGISTLEVVRYALEKFASKLLMNSVRRRP